MSPTRKATTHVSQNEGLIFEESAPGKRGFEVFVDCYNRGLGVRVTGDTLAFSPPLIVERGQIEIVRILLRQLAHRLAVIDSEFLEIRVRIARVPLRQRLHVRALRVHAVRFGDDELEVVRPRDDELVQLLLGVERQRPGQVVVAGDRRQLAAALQAGKSVLDPAGILNPGVMVP